jgi:diaminopimelate decarboxylase
MRRCLPPETEVSEPASASRSKPVHAPQREFSVIDNELIVGGISVSELMQRSGGRPFYAYDSKVIDATIATLKHRLPPAIRLHYAVKANPMPEVVAHIAMAADGLDVASAQELALALATGVAPRDISFAGPGKSRQDLSAAVDAGVILAIESATEARRIAALAEERGVAAPCAIRVNPDFELRSSGMKMGGGARPFGIDAEQVPAVLDSLRGTALDIRGFHIFSGSQNLRAEAIVETQARTVELAEKLAPHLPDGLRWLNIGGGLGVPYFPGDKPLDLAAVATALADLLEDHAALLASTEVVMELGRYLVAAAGIYACRVTDKKVSRGTTYLVTNGGLHHNLALSGNFGQVIRKNYPVAVANRVESDDLERVTIVGPLCTPLDLLGEDMLLPRADIGDTIAVFMNGAYGFTASPHRFLSHPEALEFFL